MNIQLKPSRALKRYLIWVHIVAATVALVLPVAVEFRLPLFLLLVVSLSYYLLPHAYWAKHTPVSLERNGDELWYIEYQDGHSQSGLELQSSLVTLPMIAMLFKQSDTRQKVHLLLLTDMIDKDLMRQLRVQLRHDWVAS